MAATGQYAPDDLAEVCRITAIATERFHQEGNAGLVLDNQVQHHLVEIRPMIPAVPLGDVHDLFLGLLVAVVAAIDMKARAIEMGKGGRQPQTLGGGSGNEAVEFGDPIGIERIQRPAQGIIIEMLGRSPRAK